MSGAGITPEALALLRGQFTPNPGDLRPDNSQKDVGFLGALKVPGGHVASEYSVGVPINGKETDIPTLVPGLTEDEVKLLLNDVIPNKKPIPESILRKAIEHATRRINSGMSPFYKQGEGVLKAGNPL